MRDLMILGIGAHGPEMAEIVERANRDKETWNLMGYISPTGSQIGEVINGYPVLGGMDIVGQYPQALVAPYCEGLQRLTVPRDRLATLIDPTVFVSRTAKIGVGCVLYPNCYVGLNARLGNFVFCLSGCIINHDDVIEDRTTLASGVLLAGSVHVEPDCYLGQGCNVRQYLQVRQDSMVGMGAVVVKNVPPGVVVAGNPARWLKDRG
ncbi:MAG: hypothetical protein IT210_13395 [Armatimonadetes bacterium]|nr:hypothetical protein [Armatimonadota bacterium]